jgi:hypothetical protein
MTERKPAGEFAHAVEQTPTGPRVLFVLKVNALGSKAFYRLRMTGDVLDVYDATAARWRCGFRLPRSQHALASAEAKRILEGYARELTANTDTLPAV